MVVAIWSTLRMWLVVQYQVARVCSEMTQMVELVARRTIPLEAAVEAAIVVAVAVVLVIVEIIMIAIEKATGSVAAVAVALPSSRALSPL